MAIRVFEERVEGQIVLVVKFPSFVLYSVQKGNRNYHSLRVLNNYVVFRLEEETLISFSLVVLAIWLVHNLITVNLRLLVLMVLV